MMRRRDVLAASAALPAASLAFAQASDTRVPIVVYLSLAPGPSARSDALVAGLRELGYIDGRNVVLASEWADGDLERLKRAIEERVRRGADVIVTGGPAATLAAARTTSAVPIVMAVDYDPVAAGFVRSLARPAGNVTGLSVLNPELSGKRLELLRELAPRISRVAVLRNPREPNAEAFLGESRAAASANGLRLNVYEVREAADLERNLQAAARAACDALMVLTDPVTLYHRAELVALVARHHLPAIYSERLFAEAGGLMAYGASDRELHRRAALFVDKILKGARPAELPVEQPTKFELVIHAGTARQLGLTIPSTLQLRAEVLG